MPIDPLVYVLVPAADGNQRSNDPQGNYAPPPEVTLPAPTNLRLVGDPLTSSVTLAWDVAPGQNDGTGFWMHMKTGSGDYEAAPDPFHEPTIRQSTQTGLAEDTAYTFRLFNFKNNEDGSQEFSAYSNELTVRTDKSEIIVPPPSGGDTRLRNLSFYENFESGYNGQNVREINNKLVNVQEGFVDTGERGYGTRSMRTRVRAGTSGWGHWGFVIESSSVFPRGVLGQDTEIWMRCAWKTPSNWENRSSPALKMLRVGKTKSNGPNRGWNDMYMNGQRLTFTTEIPANGDPGWHTPSGILIQNNQWYMLEIYWYMHHTARDLGGKGLMRSWVNGNLLTEYGGFGTMLNDGESLIDRGMVMNTIWNNWVTMPDGKRNPSIAPLTQTNWYDEVAIAIQNSGAGKNDRQHLDVDAHGNPYIGMATNG